jgi:hypothetical protein
MFREWLSVFRGVFEDRLTTAPETSDAADITFLPKKRASEGPGPLEPYGVIRSELQEALTKRHALCRVNPSTGR